MELISVITPAYNASAYLPGMLDSILAQDDERFEVLIVDDGSTDDTLDILREYAMRDSRLRVFHKSNGGAASARNFALERANGELLTFVDSDDWIGPHYLSALRAGLTDDIDLVFCNGEDVLPDGSFNHITDEEHSRRNKDVTVLVKDFETYGSYSHYVAWGALYRRSLAEGIRFPENFALAEDTIYFYSVLRNCKKVRHLPYCGYYYNLRPGSLSHISDHDKLSSEIDAWQFISRLFPQKSVTRRSAEGEMVIRARELFFNLCRTGEEPDMKILRKCSRKIRRYLPEGIKAFKKGRGAGARMGASLLMVGLLPKYSAERYSSGGTE